MSAQCPVCNGPIDSNDAACPTCGFKLLGSTQRFAPVAFSDEIAPEPSPKAHVASLRVVRGPQTGIVFPLSDRTLNIGRSPQCDVFLNDMTVSREHAHLKPVEGGYVIADANSFNGVWVNNASVESKRLEPGDVIQIGAFCLLYQED